MFKDVTISQAPNEVFRSSSSAKDRFITIDHLIYAFDALNDAVRGLGDWLEVIELQLAFGRGDALEL